MLLQKLSRMVLLFLIIAEIIKNGAPVLANQLLAAIWGVIQERDRLADENAALRAALQKETAKEVSDEKSTSNK